MSIFDKFSNLWMKNEDVFKEMCDRLFELPSKFKIDAPLGSYNPGWAYFEDVEGRERVCFVIETKGKALGPNFKYDVEVKCHYVGI